MSQIEHRWALINAMHNEFRPNQLEKTNSSGEIWKKKSFKIGNFHWFYTFKQCAPWWWCGECVQMHFKSLLNELDSATEAKHHRPRNYWDTLCATMKFCYIISCKMRTFFCGPKVVEESHIDFFFASSRLCKCLMIFNYIVKIVKEASTMQSLHCFRNAINSFWLAALCCIQFRVKWRKRVENAREREKKNPIMIVMYSHRSILHLQNDWNAWSGA